MVAYKDSVILNLSKYISKNVQINKKEKTNTNIHFTM